MSSRTLLLELGNLPEEEQHIAMSNIFVEDIAEAINQYLGGNGSWEDYEYLVWHGLSQYPDYANDQWFIDHLQDAKLPPRSAIAKLGGRARPALLVCCRLPSANGYRPHPPNQ